MNRKQGFADEILGISYGKLFENSHGKIARKDAFKLLSRGVKINKNIAKQILKELEDMGLLENRNRGIVLKKKVGV